MKSLILIPFLLGGCSLLFSGYTTHADTTQDQNDIELSIETDRNIYSQSGHVKIVMRIRNTGRESVTLEFPSSRQYDFIVIKDDQEVWRWSRDKYFTQAFTTVAIEPGDLLTYTAEWDQKDNISKSVGPGIYIIKGILPAIGRESSASLSIIIE